MKPQHWLERYWPIFAIWHCGLAMMALHFGVTVLLGGSPVTPELYGPAVYAIPAIVWAGAQFGGAAISCAGAMMGRRGAGLLLAGGSLSLPFYAFLAAASSMSGQGVIVTAGAIWVVLPTVIASIIAAMGAIVDGR